MFLLGCFAFVLFFLSDYNDAKLHRRLLIFLFPIGAILLAASIVLQIGSEAARITDLLGQTAVWIIFSLNIVLLIYSLFFSFPATKAYGALGEKRGVYNTGIYALCRHPGVICLVIILFCIWLVEGIPLYTAIVYSLLDVALVSFEDKYVFPQVLYGYEEYISTTPFLIPTTGSIKNALAIKRTESVTGR